MILAGGVQRTPWVDEDGRTWVSIMPTGTNVADGWRFPVLGPPPIAASLERDGWPQGPANAVQAELVAAGILTARQIRVPANSAQIDGMIRRAFRGSVQTVIDAFVAASGGE